MCFVYFVVNFVLNFLTPNLPAIGVRVIHSQFTAMRRTRMSILHLLRFFRTSSDLDRTYRWLNRFAAAPPQEHWDLIGTIQGGM